MIGEVVLFHVCGCWVIRQPFCPDNHLWVTSSCRLLFSFAVCPLRSDFCREIYVIHLPDL
jgi:hypothetical protein